MGTFSNKIVAEFTPPKTWMLEDELAFETEDLKDEDIKILENSWPGQTTFLLERGSDKYKDLSYL